MAGCHWLIEDFCKVLKLWMKCSATEVGILAQSDTLESEKGIIRSNRSWIMSASFKFTEGAPCASASRLNSKIQPLKAGSSERCSRSLSCLKMWSVSGLTAPLLSINSSSSWRVH